MDKAVTTATIGFKRENSDNIFHTHYVITLRPDGP